SGIDYVSGSAALQFHVADGQVYNDQALVVNGTTIGPPPFVFKGDTVPGAGGYPPPTCQPTQWCYGFLWDIKPWDVTSLLSPGANSLGITMNPPRDFEDCISMVVVIADLPKDAALPPEPRPEPSMRGAGGGASCEEDTAEPPPANSSAPPP